MIKANNPPFNVTLLLEGDYYRLSINHQFFKKRIRKRVGNVSPEDLEKIKFHLKYELENHFETNKITREAVEQFTDDFISLKIKCNASILRYFDEFINYKSQTTNRKTRQRLAKATITAYRKSEEYFEKFLVVKKILPHPAMINKMVLDDYYFFIPGAVNYKVKMHGKIKAFLKYVDEIKGVSLDPSFRNSSFVEVYDNQETEDDDRALSIEEVHCLIELRKKLYTGEIGLEKAPTSKKIPVELQEKLFKMKKDNLTKTLDCFLFMVSSGQYFSDITKSVINLSYTGAVPHLRYRRAKNNSLCRGIPIRNDGVFIGKELIEQYDIKSGTNFPLNLSLTHFNLHLGKISELAGFSFKLNNKMARKTFASLLYFNAERPMPINYVQIMLGHKNIKDTAHYLRIQDDDIAREIDSIMSLRRE